MLKKFSVVFALTLFFFYGAFASSETKKQNRPYIVLFGPQNLTQVRVNIENYAPNGAEVKKFEINFGDGTLVSNSKDVFHTYLVNQKYTITTRTWDNKGLSSIYSEIIDINSSYRVRDIENSSVLGPINMDEMKKYSLVLTEQQSTRLYKLKINRSPSVANHSNNDKCKRDYNVEINKMEIFKEAEINCDITQIESFIKLGTNNVVKFEADRSRNGTKFKVEIHKSRRKT